MLNEQEKTLTETRASCTNGELLFKIPEGTTKIKSNIANITWIYEFDIVPLLDEENN